MPARRLTRAQAITAMTLTETVAAKYVRPDSEEWQQCSAWAAERGLALEDAMHWITLPLDPAHEQPRPRPRSPQRQREADFEAGG